MVFETVTFLQQPQLGSGQFTLQGDWVEAGQLNIWRNAEAAGKVNAYNWRPRLLPISWPDAPAPDQAFWQLKAQLDDGTLKVVEAAGPFPHPPRLEKLPDFRQLYQREQRVGTSNKPPLTIPAAKPKKINWSDITPVSGKLELSIKFNTLPQVQEVNGRYHFKIECDGRIFLVSLKQKMWAKLETASANYEQWVAALAGKLGAATADGFVLEDPNIQVFERQQSKQLEQPKESLKAPQVQAAATEPSHITSEPTAKSIAKIPQTKTQAVETATADNGQNSAAKPDPLARPSTAKAESKPKKVGKINVEIR